MLNIRPDTIKLLEENVEENLVNDGLGKSFIDMTSKAQVMKAKLEDILITQKLAYQISYTFKNQFKHFYWF